MILNLHPRADANLALGDLDLVFLADRVFADGTVVGRDLCGGPSQHGRWKMERKKEENKSNNEHCSLTYLDDTEAS